jgi:hypothetical protein
MFGGTLNHESVLYLFPLISVEDVPVGCCDTGAAAAVGVLD